jgi:hypothetical protein
MDSMHDTNCLYINENQLGEGCPITPNLKCLNALHCVCMRIVFVNGPSARKFVMILDHGDQQAVACMNLY